MEYISLSDEEEEYAVEAILDYKRKNGKDYFMVKWQGYNDPDWEEASNLTNCSELVRDFFMKRYRAHCASEGTQAASDASLHSAAHPAAAPKAILGVNKERGTAHVCFRDDSEDSNYPLDALSDLYPDLVCSYYLKGLKRSSFV